MLYLASASPRRRELLQQIGVAFTRVEASINETPRPGEAAASYVQRMATGKAQAGLHAVQQNNAAEPWPVLGADTVVVANNTILGKPANRAAAVRTLQQLSNNWHQVITAVTVTNAQQTEHAMRTSRVRFRTLSTAEIERYWQTGEPADKAGSYAIQGLGAVFVAELQGSYSGVVGLPLLETQELLARFGLVVL